MAKSFIGAPAQICRPSVDVLHHRAAPALPRPPRIPALQVLARAALQAVRAGPALPSPGVSVDFPGRSMRRPLSLAFESAGAGLLGRAASPCGRICDLGHRRAWRSSARSCRGGERGEHIKRTNMRPANFLLLGVQRSCGGDDLHACKCDGFRMPAPPLSSQHGRGPLGRRSKAASEGNRGRRAPLSAGAMGFRWHRRRSAGPGRQARVAMVGTSRCAGGEKED
jgi:hypothetical protein